MIEVFGQSSCFDFTLRLGLPSNLWPVLRRVNAWAQLRLPQLQNDQQCKHTVAKRCGKQKPGCGIYIRAMLLVDHPHLDRSI
jgi:hypothetical protein